VRPFEDLQYIVEAVVADVFLEALDAVDVPPSIPHSPPVPHGTLQQPQNVVAVFDIEDRVLKILCL
jgi:hypothetical protein